jgi:hypothetical protein
LFCGKLKRMDFTVFDLLEANPNLSMLVICPYMIFLVGRINGLRGYTYQHFSLHQKVIFLIFSLVSGPAASTN